MSNVLATLYPPSREHPAGIVDAAYVEQVGANGTGRLCGECGVVTFGQSERCGRCGKRTAR